MFRFPSSSAVPISSSSIYRGTVERSSYKLLKRCLKFKAEKDPEMFSKKGNKKPLFLWDMRKEGQLQRVVAAMNKTRHWTLLDKRFHNQA